jgi:hypothetical protein
VPCLKSFLHFKVQSQYTVNRYNPYSKVVCVCSSLVKRLLSMHKALVSIPSMVKHQTPPLLGLL